MQNEPDEALIDATMANDLDEIRNAIQLGLDINHQNFFGKTALHYAESIEAARLLIEHGADPNLVDYNNRPPLFDVNDPGLAVFLIDHGANAQFQDKDGLTALYIWVDFPEVVQRLLDEGADPNVQLVTGSMIIKRGNTALHKVGNLESARLLVEHGANATIRNVEKATPVHTTSGEIQRYLKSVYDQQNQAKTDSPTNSGEPSLPGTTDTRLAGDTTVYHKTT